MSSVSRVALVVACAWVTAVGCSDGENGVAANAGSGGASPCGVPGETGGSTTSTGGRASNGGAAATFGGLTSSTTGGSKTTGGGETTGGTETTGGASPGGEGGSLGGPSGDECDPPLSEELIFDGDLIVTSDNYAEAQEYTGVTGDLVPDTAEIELPKLRRVGGSIQMTGAPSETGDEPEIHLSFPHLEEVGGEFYFYLNWGLRTLDARRLERVGERVYIHRNKSLEDMQLESLVEYGADLEITGNTSLPDCYLDTVRELAPNVQKGILGCTCVRDECGGVTASCP